MNSNPQAVPKLVAVGASLALLSMLLGFLLGVAFGAKEDSIKAHLNQSGAAVLETVYEGDEAAQEAVARRSWGYLKRAHLHGGAIGASAIGAILLLILLCRLDKVARLSALALGAGALIYSLFWLFAGLMAPGLGGTGAAKESLGILAIPGAGLCTLGLLGTIYSVLKSSFFGSE